MEYIDNFYILDALVISDLKKTCVYEFVADTTDSIIPQDGLCSAIATYSQNKPRKYNT